MVEYTEDQYQGLPDDEKLKLFRHDDGMYRDTPPAAGGRKKRGKKSRKSRKGKKPRKGKKSRKNKRRTKRR